MKRLYIATDGVAALTPSPGPTSRLTMKRVLAALIWTHRYLGVALCLVFVSWFASGIVMVFHRMPEFAAEERRERLPRLDPAAVRLSPAEAFEAAGLQDAPDHVLLTTSQGRPVYRFVLGPGSLTVFADDGRYVDSARPQDAVAVVEQMFPEHRGGARLIETRAEPDQWTIGNRFDSTGALHVVSLGDVAATHLYVAEATGEIVMKTDRKSRFWGYAGPVMHWFYFTPLRAERAPLWSNLIVYGSVVGCLLCVLGLVIGLYRFSIARRYLHGTSMTPYAGWLRWHHYAGLLFGVVTFTFTFSGLLTMTPWNLFPGGGPTREMVAAIRGDGIALDRFALPPSAALAALQTRFAPKEVELIQFMGTPFYAAYDGSRRVLVSAGSGPLRTRDGFTRDELLTAATAAMSGLTPTDVAWLTEYDAYYYSRTGAAPLPVLRTKFDDPDQTWLYLNANDASIVRAEVAGSRTERWLSQALHSLDFPGLYQTGWIWYPLIIGLSLGGLVLSATAVIIARRVLRL